MIEFPDVSNYEPGLSLAGAVACIAKASEGTTFTDPYYVEFRTQAANLGIPFAAYHWVNTRPVAAQAAHAFSVVGPHTPIMWDAEADGSTVPALLELTKEYRALGGVATLVYLPHWWWKDHLGSPDLRPLADAGLALVSSDYDGMPPDGWQPYGGITPAVWQFTSRRPFNGQTLDFNRFNGTVGELASVFMEGSAAMPTADEIAQAILRASVTTIGVHDATDVPDGYTQPLVEYIKWLPTIHDQLVELNAAVGNLAAAVAALPAASSSSVPDHEHTPGPVARPATTG